MASIRNWRSKKIWTGVLIALVAEMAFAGTVAASHLAYLAIDAPTG